MHCLGERQGAVTYYVPGTVLPNPSFRRQQLLHPAHLARFKADLDAMGMGRRLGQNVSDHASCKLSAALILLLYDLHL